MVRGSPADWEQRFRTKQAADHYQWQLFNPGSSGHIIATPVNNRTLLQDFARSHGVSDLSTLGLAYHVGGNELGDTIEVINRTDGSTVYTLFGLSFGESFGRTALLSGSGKQLKRLEYIYTDQNSHSLGSAVLTDYYFFDSNGQTNATYVLGQMQYIVTRLAIKRIPSCARRLSTR